MDYTAHVFVYALLAGLAAFILMDLFGERVVAPHDPHCATHTPHSDLSKCASAGHDHDMDGDSDDPINAHFHEQDAAHHHQTGNVASHPGEFDASHPHHRNQIDSKNLCGF